MIEWFVKKKNIKLKSNVLPLSFLVLFITIYLLSKMNVNIMYSAFIGGYIMKSLLPQEDKDIAKIKTVLTEREIAEKVKKA